MCSLIMQYLTKGDFKSLGFVHREDRGMSENNGYMFTIKDPHFEKADITIRYWVSAMSYRLKIERISGCIFDGNIKTKTELETLLKQLGII